MIASLGLGRHTSSLFGEEDFRPLNVQWFPYRGLNLNLFRKQLFWDFVLPPQSGRSCPFFQMCFSTINWAVTFSLLRWSVVRSRGGQGRDETIRKERSCFHEGFLCLWDIYVTYPCPWLFLFPVTIQFIQINGSMNISKLNDSPCKVTFEFELGLK